MIEVADEPLVIPAPVLVEVDYWVHLRMHAGVFTALLDDITARAYEVADVHPDDYPRIRDICDRYDDVGFVDAAVLALVERLRESKLATLDHRHFGVLRPRHVSALQLLPESTK